VIVNKPNKGLAINRAGQEERLMEILQSVKFEVPEIHAVMLVSSEGLPIASTQFGISQDETILSAMTAALVSVAEQTSLELDKGDPSSLIVECPRGLIVLQRIDEDVLISVVTRDGIRLGLLLLALKKANEKILQVL